MASTYEQLWQTADKLRIAAITADLDARGFTYKDGKIENTSIDTPETLQAVLDSTVAKYAHVPDMFIPYLGMPDPGPLRSYGETVRGVAQKLNYGQSDIEHHGIVANPQLGAIDEVGGLVKDWYGQAALEFKKNFLDTWKPITSNQFQLAVAVMCAAQAEAAVWQNARDNVAKIADSAVSAMDALSQHHFCGNGDGKLGFNLTVLSAIGAITAVIAAEVLTGGAATPVVIAVVAEVTATAGAYPFKQPEAGDISGGNPGEVVKNVQTALDKLKQQIIDGENHIKDALDSAVNVIQSSSKLVVAPRPNLANATAKNIKDDKTGLGSAED